VHEWGADPVLEEAPDPRPAGAESLVAVHAASVAHIDLTVASGEFAHKPPLPHVPGTEGAGTIVESATYEAGARVRIRGAGVGIWRAGTCSELAAIPDEALAPIPDEASFEAAASFFSPCLTAYAALHQVGELRAGERVVVTGASGAVGSIAMQLAEKAGAEVIAITRDPGRAPAIPAGAEVRAPGDSDLEADLLFDTVGGPHLPALLLGAVKPGGRAVLVGYAAGEQLTLPLPLLMAADVRLLPMNLIRRGAGLEDVAAGLLDDIVSGDLTLPITVLELDEIAEALERIRAGTAMGRVALRVRD
jgi:NADPH:quinone reductase-like Zn-dependent oxidoreductase